ncbi:peptidase S41 [Antarcticibacterium flavum]|uniref:Peptidase S41 n=1 Tax=Antarcticibacterium flavum TaxID=2058175 RepID=A0A5B7X1F5_9FLAO|nr:MULTISPECIES: S41 family peptidase [Antarcticibacterium]MCM4161230.1 peptidase S41 [Antarcticibacterium sp. W02-3]QCY68453.1 peptidase S41 [Antarcticibacterium flavum]
MKQFIHIISFLFATQVFAQMPADLTATDKVYGLSKFWQEVNYNFVYLNKIDREAWDEEYKKLIIQVQETTNDYEYFRLLEKFCAMLNDGHTNIYMPQNVRDQLNNQFEGYSLRLTGIEGQVIIAGINESKQEELPIGTRILEVNALPVQEYLDLQIKPFISSSTSYVLEEMAIHRMFQAPIGKTFQIKFHLPNGRREEMELRIAARNTEEPFFPPLNKKELLEFKWMAGNTAYLALNSFDDPAITKRFREILPELYKAKNLIIDLRDNGGGNTSIGREILQYLIEDEILYSSRSRSRMHIPTLKAWGRWTAEKDTIQNEGAKRTFLAFRDELYHSLPYKPDTLKIKEKRIIVPTALLISSKTASAAEDFLIYAHGKPHMIKIGEPTFGSTGQPLAFELPGNAFARICTKQDTYPDGREFVGVGILPDIEVKKTLAQYIENSDPVLEKAMEYLETKQF